MQSLIMAKKVDKEDLEFKEAKEMLNKAGKAMEEPIKTSFGWVTKHPKRLVYTILILLAVIGLIILWFTYIQPTVNMLNDTNKNLTIVTSMLQQKKAADSVKVISDKLSDSLILKTINDGFKDVNGNLANMINSTNNDFKTLIKYVSKNKKDRNDLEEDILNDHIYLQKKIESDAIKNSPQQQFIPKN